MAGEAAARSAAAELKSILGKWYAGTPFRASIELQQGRGEWLVTKYLRMHHHTVSKPTMGLTPCLAICKEGRSDVPGPLCNGYGGYDGVYRIITMGLANHPGQGGPITIDGVYVPEDSARTPTWGTEWEGGLEPWSSFMAEFMGRTDCALAEWMGRPLTSQLEHSTWTDRKIDRLGYTRTSAINLTNYWHSRLYGDAEMSAAEVADLKNHFNQQIVRLGSFLARGAGNALFDPATQPWVDDPNTKTLNEVFEAGNLANFYSKLTHDLLAPNGFGFVDPKTGRLVPQGTAGSAPAYDVWRWTRESVEADRLDDDRHVQLTDIMGDLTELVVERLPRPVEEPAGTPAVEPAGT